MERFPDQREIVIDACRTVGRFDVLHDIGEEIGEEIEDIYGYVFTDVSDSVIADIFGKFYESHDMRSFVAKLMFDSRTNVLRAISTKYDIAPLVAVMTIGDMRLSYTVNYRYEHGSRPISVIRWAREVNMAWGEMHESMFHSAYVIQFMHDEGYEFTQREMLMAIKLKSLSSVLLLLSFGVTVPNMDTMRGTGVFLTALAGYPLMRNWIKALGDGDVENEMLLREQVCYNNATKSWRPHFIGPYRY